LKLSKVASIPSKLPHGLGVRLCLYFVKPRGREGKGLGTLERVLVTGNSRGVDAQN